MANVVITGGSRGIGAAAVELFAARGDRVWFLYEKNHEAAASVAERTGAVPICCDVADTAAVQQVFRQIPDVDVLICNAGVVLGTGLMSMMSPEDWDRIFAVNVKGVYNCVNAAMPAFLRKHSGSITINAVVRQKRGKDTGGGLMKSLFPAASSLEGRYPYLKKHPALLPVAWASRIVRYAAENSGSDSAARSIRLGNERMELMKQYGILDE